MGFDLSAVMAAAPKAVEAWDIETLTDDILRYKNQAGTAIIQIGRCLEKAKAMLPHGEWLPWLQERAEFSERTAARFMRLAREWADPAALSDLGASKALSLLALNPAEREEFIAEAHVVDGTEKTAAEMSTRELEKAIQERKAALEAKEAAEAGKRAAEAAQAKMAQDMEFANKRLEALAEEATTQGGTVERLRAELETLRAQPVDMTVSSVAADSALEEARRAGAEEAAKTAWQEAEAKLKEKLDKAAKAKADAEAALKTALAERDTLQNRTAALERQVKAASGKDLATASVCFEAAQENVNKVLGVVQKLAVAGNFDEHNKLVDALHALFFAMDARVPKKLEVKENA